MLKGKKKKLQKAPHPSTMCLKHKTVSEQPPSLNWEKENTLPITILMGFLGSGKTTMLKYALENTEGKKIAVIVNDLAEVNVDAALVKKKKSKGGNRKMVELTNGCMCCALKDDLLVAIRDLAKKGQYDYLIVEASGVAEPLPVLEGIFNFDVGRGKVLADIVRLDAMIIVVDSNQFLKDYNCTQGVLDREELVKEMGLAAPEVKGKKATKKEKKLAKQLEQARSDARNHPISSLLAEQVECADLLVLNKTDLVSEEDISRLEGIVQALNPDALVKKTQFGRLPLEEIFNTHLFSFEKASKSAGWLKVLNGEYVVKAKQIGINNFVYKARRPFHPKRLWDLVEGDTLDACIRSKGFIWLATANEVIGDWAHAGENFNFEAGGPWFATLDESEWPGDEQTHAAIRKDFDSDPSIGDRRQEIVFIGIQMDEAAIREKLDQALLTEEELKMGATGWKQFEDPFDAFFTNW